MDKGSHLLQPVIEGKYVSFLLAFSPSSLVLLFLSSGWNGFIYVIKGKGYFGGKTAAGSESWTESTPHHTLVLGPGDHINVKNEVKKMYSNVFTKLYKPLSFLSFSFSRMMNNFILC